MAQTWKCVEQVYPCRRYGLDMEAGPATSTLVGDMAQTWKCVKQRLSLWEIWPRHGSVLSNVYPCSRNGPDTGACRERLPLQEIWPRHPSMSSNVYPFSRYGTDTEACRATSTTLGDMVQTRKLVEQRLPF